jgi:Xaa-Pro aminopeptidase
MYHSDCTRTIVIDELPKEQKSIFHIVKQVQMETLQQVKAGMKCSELDSFARSMIEKSGYGNYFQHSLGMA